MFHGELVLVDEGRVTQPVGDGVLVLRWLDDEGVLGVEVEAAYVGQHTVAIGVEEREMVGLAPFGLQVVAVGDHLAKGSQADVVGQEVCVVHALDAGDV